MAVMSPGRHHGSHVSVAALSHRASGRRPPSAHRHWHSVATWRHHCCCLLLAVLLGMSALATIAEGQKIVVRNLTCYECGENTFPGDRSSSPCLYFNISFFGAHKQVCATDQRFCMVQRHNLNDKWVFAERRCSAVCEAGCWHVGDVQTLTDCWSCCEDNLCNTDNGAHGSPATTTPSTGAAAAAILTSLLVTATALT